MKIAGRLYILFFIAFLGSCSNFSFDRAEDAGHIPLTDPDYSDVTIPYNIAPLNFVLKETGDNFAVQARSADGSDLTLFSSDGKISFPEKKWKKMLEENKGGEIEVTAFSAAGEKVLRYTPFKIYVSEEPADPYIVYRLLYPGYEIYVDLKIMQRNVESFSESSILENQVLDNNCVNCHSFNKNDPEKFLVHLRGTKNGTYFVDGDRITKINLKTKEMDNGAVYPAWHPGGRFVSFSSNNIIQSFHSIAEKLIEVHDLASSLVLYDIEKNEIMEVNDTAAAKYMDTFPEWSPDGKYLYFCRAKSVDKEADFRIIKYNLARKSFDPVTRSFGPAEIIFDAESNNRSVSFPRISPDGKYLVFTYHDYGTFSIWHKEADLYLMDLETLNTSKMPVNSDETDSWHCWSSNGKWLVFSSKRGDGLTARPYFAYFGGGNNIGKPFVLPQKDPSFYRNTLYTFNRPEFIKGKIRKGPRDFSRVADKKALNAEWAGDK